MKKISGFKIVFFLLILLFSICFFTSCSNTTENENNITFNYLSVNGTNVYGKVSNATNTFSFIDEVKTNGSSEYIVSLDIYGKDQVLTKTIPLSVGNNIVYVIEMIDNEPKTIYEVTIRRKPIYVVSFNSNGGTAITTQSIEEDSFAIIPEEKPIKEGYIFSSWDYDFNQPITKNTTIQASWEPKTNTPYKVEYWLENIENNNYTLMAEETENLVGTTNTIVFAELKTFDHYNPQTEIVQGVISPDGTTTLQVYYLRERYLVHFNKNGGTLKSGSENQYIKHGGSATAPIFEREGYTFIEYDKSYNLILKSIEVSAVWKINQYTITLALNNGEANKTIRQDYNTEIKEVSIPERKGYVFDGWNIPIPSKMPAQHLSITAEWTAIFNVSFGSITGLTNYGKTLTIIEVPDYIDGIEINTIRSSAFDNCSTLKELRIYTNIISLGFNSLGGCNKLESITLPFVGGGNNWDDNFFGYIFGATYHSKNAEYVPSTLKHVTILGGETINSNAFYGCSSLEKVFLSKDITEIGNQAFYYCNSLNTIVFEKNSNLNKIGYYAFLDTSLETIYFGNTKANWLNINIDKNNSNLSENKLYYYSETIPTEEGNYWHYDNNGNIVTW